MRPLALPGRRRVLTLAAAVPLTTAAAFWGGSHLVSRGRRTPTLLSNGLVVGGGGALYPLAPGDTVAYVPGTRLPEVPEPRGLTTSRRDALVRQALARREAARLPEGRWADLADGALTDLLALTGPALMAGPVGPATRPTTSPAPIPAPATSTALATTGPADPEGSEVRDPLPQGADVFPSGAVVAAPVSIWRYVWPRDAAFAAAALSAVNLPDEALGVLGNLASWQRSDGGFEARYTSSGQVPDNRPAQTDGAGWFLWATGRLHRPAPEAHGHALAPARGLARLLGGRRDGPHPGHGRPGVPGARGGDVADPGRSPPRRPRGGAGRPGDGSAQRHGAQLRPHLGPAPAARRRRRRHRPGPAALHPTAGRGSRGAADGGRTHATPRRRARPRVRLAR